MSTGPSGGFRDALSAREVEAFQTLLFWFGAFVVSGAAIADMLAIAWSSMGIVRTTIRGVLFLLGLSPAVAYYLPAGLFFGVMTALLFDTYKRQQGILLWVGVLVALLFVFVPRGIVIGLLTNFTWIGFGLGLVSFGAGLHLAGVTTARFAEESSPPFEYPRAPRILLGLLAVVCVVGFVEAHVLYQPPFRAVPDGGFASASANFNGFSLGLPFLIHAGAIGVGLVALREFTQYEREFNVFVIGPRRSGKTAAFGGFHAAVEDMLNKTLLNKAGTTRARDRIQAGFFPESTTTTTQNLVTLEFQTDEPLRFPEKVRLQSVDYAGETLRDILAEFVDVDQQYDLPPFSSETGELSKTVRPTRPADPSDGATQSDDGWADPVATDGDGPRVGGERDTGDDTPAREWADDGDTHAAADSSGGTGSDDAWGFMNEDGTDDEGTSKSDDTGLGATGRAGGGGAGAPSPDGEDYVRADSWEEATRRVRETTVKNDPRPIQDCLRHADRIVLTVPLDDLAGPLIERDVTPDYYETIRAVDTPLAEALWEAGYRKETGLKPVYRVGDDFFHRHHVVGAPTRAPPWQYLAWYRQLAETFEDTDFVVMLTMADWGVDGFKRDNEDQNAASPNPVQRYDRFREYLFDQVVTEWPGRVTSDIQRESLDDYPYPVWYTITNESPIQGDGDTLRIDANKQGHILNGAGATVDRLSK
jgi:hypothetical protein